MEIRKPADQLPNKAKTGVSRLLRPYGLSLKGYEVRGWRYSPLRYVFPRRRLLPRTIPYRLMTPMQRWFDPQKRLLAYLDARDRLRAGAMCAPTRRAVPFSR